MNLNFVKIESDHDIDNDLEIEKKQDITSEPGEVGEPWKNATELQET